MVLGLDVRALPGANSDELDGSTVTEPSDAPETNAKSAPSKSMAGKIPAMRLVSVIWLVLNVTRMNVPKPNVGSVNVKLLPSAIVNGPTSASTFDRSGK